VNFENQARRIDEMIRHVEPLAGRLVRVTRLADPSEPSGDK
jgi:hypothetical protein